MNSPEVNPFGDKAINITWDKKIDPELHDYILNYERYLQLNFTEFNFESVVTYHSMVIYLTDKNDQKKFLDTLKNLNSNKIKSIKRKSYTWEIPTCYHPKFGIDLSYVAENSQCSVEEVIRIHSKEKYRIYFTGFLPGFLYLGGLDEKIACPRKTEPRNLIEAGSVGIAGSQTGIYPQNSPGGWQIIARIPFSLFNRNENPPSIFNSGDLIQFNPIKIAEYEYLKEKYKSDNNPTLKSTLND